LVVERLMLTALFRARHFWLVVVMLIAGVLLAKLTDLGFLSGRSSLVKGAKVNFKVPEARIREVVLENGMRVVAYQDNRSPKVRLQIA
jgi:hypothetical protein